MSNYTIASLYSRPSDLISAKWSCNVGLLCKYIVSSSCFNLSWYFSILKDHCTLKSNQLKEGSFCETKGYFSVVMNSLFLELHQSITNKSIQ